MMASPGKKRLAEGAVSLQRDIAKKKCTPRSTLTDYDKCLICQSTTSASLRHVSSKERLVQAMQARMDEVSKRLQADMDKTSDSWLDSYGPQWHEKCRNWYTNEKSYKLAEKKRQLEKTEDSNDPICSTSKSTILPQPTRRTRTETQAFDAKTACVICNKRWMKGKEPKCKVSTETSQNSIIQKAKDLQRDDILLRLIGQGHDMIANDISYHLTCMNAFRATRIPSVQFKVNLYDVAFSRLVQQIDSMLFEEAKGFFVKSLRDRYRCILKELDVKGAETYRSVSLKARLEQHYGKRISIIGQTGGSGFICSSSLSLGDALQKLQQLQADMKIDENFQTLQRAAKLLRADCKQCKHDTQEEQSTEISFEAADKLVPDSLFNFASMLLYDKVAKPRDDSKRVELDVLMKEKVLILSQQLLQHTYGICTPLSIATAYHLYNQTRSKSLITLSNRLHQSISYDTLHRQLTSVSTDIMQQMEEDGIYIPSNVTRNTTNSHVFALDNLDWRKKTLDGGSFHATTAIVIENANDTTPEDNAVNIPTLTAGTSTVRSKTLSGLNDDTSTFPAGNVTKRDRQTSRSLQEINTLASLETESDGTAEDILLLWKIGRVLATSQVISIPDDARLEELPGFSAFCASLSTHHEASKIGYLSLIPASPTDPAVMKEEMARITKISKALGDKYTVITGDQATYELARTIRDKYPEEFENVVLLLGGFHLAHNYLKAICKIMRDSGAEDILVSSGLCTAGTARKMFGEKAEYYQTLYAIRLLSEAMWHLYWEAFETWAAEQVTSQWSVAIETVLRSVLTKQADKTKQQLEIAKARPHLEVLQDQMSEFELSIQDSPTAVFWTTFLQMTDILQRFIFYQREGNWNGHLEECANMLPYLAAAGHYKYAQQSLPLYLSEMKKLPETSPELHQMFLAGAFVGRRSAGEHNGVSPDMLLEQTYNADAKEASGLDGITLNKSARTKWVYTKHVTASVSAELKTMLHLNSTQPHHESGPKRVAHDNKLVMKMTAATETNPFMSNSENLVNITTGQCADDTVKTHLTSVKELGTDALNGALTTTKSATVKVNLQTFYTQNQKPKKTKPKHTPGKCDEVSALLRITQVIASGGKVDIENFIGNHECSKTPPSLFTEDGEMRSGSKATLLKAIKDDTGIQASTCLPPVSKQTAVVVDAMHVIRQWSFEKGETFGDVAHRYSRILRSILPAETDILHICCDSYSSNSTKAVERQKRYDRSKSGKVYEVKEHYETPDPKEFFGLSKNKEQLQDFLCEEWSNWWFSSSHQGPTKLYLGGGFCDKTKAVLVSPGNVQPVLGLQSTQDEADTRVLLHTLYTAQNEDVERVVIYANDTDIIVLAVYYAATHLSLLQELWVRNAPQSYLPIHEIAAKLGKPLCRALPFIHSMSGRDTTSYPYFTGKKAWLANSKTLDLSALEAFAEDEQSCEVTDVVVSQARELMLAVYSNKHEEFQGASLSKLRVFKFLNNKSTLLKILPPTEDAFLQHVRRAALATLIDKRAHIPKPPTVSVEEYGWALMDDNPVPVMSTQLAWPQQMKSAASCKCTKGCNRNCSCAKNGIPCYVGCRCGGSVDRCSRAQQSESEESELDEQ